MNKMDIDKNGFREQVVNILEARLTATLTAYEYERITTIESDGRMVSRYDTAGIEAAYVADGLARNVLAMREEIARVRDFLLPDNPERVCMGSVVVFAAGKENSEKWFFLLPGGGGTKVQQANAPDITVLTLLAPMAKSLFHKKVNEEVLPAPASVGAGRIALIA